MKNPFIFCHKFYFFFTAEFKTSKGKMLGRRLSVTLLVYLLYPEDDWNDFKEDWDLLPLSGFGFCLFVL